MLSTGPQSTLQTHVKDLRCFGKKYISNGLTRVSGTIRRVVGVRTERDERWKRKSIENTILK